MKPLKERTVSMQKQEKPIATHLSGENFRSKRGGMAGRSNMEADRTIRTRRVAVVGDGLDMESALSMFGAGIGCFVTIGSCYHEE